MSVLNLLSAPRNSRSGNLRFTFAILAVLVAIAAFSSPEFFTAQNVKNVIAQTAPLILASIGQMMVVVTGGLDVSNGAVVSLTTTLVAMPYHDAINLSLAFGAALMIGLANGYGVARLNVHPIIMTLATMSIAQGIALLLRPIPGGDVPAWLIGAVNGNLWAIPGSLLWIVVPACAAAWLLYRRPFGVHLFAAGGNAENARLNGIKTQRIIIAAYVLSSLFAFIAGLYLAGRLSSGDAKVGNAFNIDSVMAVALGGVQLSGGVGSLLGTVIGALLVSLIGNTMNLSNISAFVQLGVKGLLLLAVVSLQRRKEIGL